MEDKNKSLKDKLDSSYDIKEGKNKDIKNQAIIGALVLVALIIVFFVIRNLGGNKNEINNEQIKTQDSIYKEESTVKDKKVTKLDEGEKEKQYKIQESSEKENVPKLASKESKKGTKGLVKRNNKNRDESLEIGEQNILNKEDFDEGTISGLLNTTLEYILINPDTTQARIDYYNANTMINNELDSYFLSEEDGYTDDKERKDSEKYTSITKESVEKFITHEIEKEINSHYMGGDEKAYLYDIKDINIENFAIGNEFGNKLNYYTVNYYASDPQSKNKSINGSFTFYVDLGGNISWEEN